MSVVNQMLKDLEQREHAGQTSASAVYQAPVKHASPKLYVLVGVLTALVLVMIAVVGWTYFNAASSDGQNTTNQHDSESIVSEPVSKAEDPSTALVAIDTNAEPDVTEARPMRVVGAAQDSVVASETASDPLPEQTPIEVLSTAEVSQPQQSALSAAPSEPVEAEQLPTEPSESIVPALPEETLVAVFSKQSSGAEQTGVSLREQALAAVRAGQDEQAIVLLERLLTTEPDNLAARKKLAALLFAKGRALNAQSILEIGIQRQPQESTMRLMLARLLAQQQLVQSALDTLNPAFELQPIGVEFLGFRASLADQLERFDLALADYQRLTQMEPNQARWWLGLGIANERNQRSNEALIAYQQALALNQLSIDVQRFVQQRSALLVGVE